MLAEIITIGDEILIGQITDTNSAWLAGRLNESGIRVGRITSLPDVGEEIRRGIEEALERCSLVFLTGGLGPTKDDITKTTLARWFGTRLVRHEPTYRMLEKRMAERGFDFNPLNQAQADVPEGCRVIRNDNGTAPGMWFEKGGKIVISMPGVPFEMKAMAGDRILPELRERFGLERYVHKTAYTYGIPESALALLLSTWEDALPADLKLAYLPNPSGIRLRLSYYGEHPSDAERRIDERFAEAVAILGDHFLGFGQGSVETDLAQLLTARGETLAVAESCTGGAVAGKFTRLPGASHYFKGGVVAYTDAVKSDLLGIDREVIERCGAVSRRVAEEMARRVSRQMGSDYGIATTGVAGPEGGTDENPVGTVWMAVSTPSGVFAEKKNFGLLREVTIERAATQAIDMLREYLRNQNPNNSTR